MSNEIYQQQLAQEAELWGQEAETQAAATPPDWRYHRLSRQNVIMHTDDIEQLLSVIRPGMVTLELGCASGWLTLAMAQCGAYSAGMDISQKALDVARCYYASIRGEVSGSVTYQAADLNSVELPAETYDVVAVKGTLHHLVGMEHLILQVHQALKPGGLLWVSDSNGEESLPTVLIASALMFLLPTHVSYGQKFRGLLRFGAAAPSRIRASMQAEGLSPFEGAGREHDWVKLIYQHFQVERRVDAPAFTGYITAQLKLPDALAIPLLKTLRAIDRLLVRLRLLRNTGVVLYARKS
jgi:2-polyprenyl-3-methyl-5-hydroxy-6-metoxy-1,4-benzoquinol methylase